VHKLAEKTVSEEHQFLYHYTTWEALNGMLTTNEIWATHVRNLNDETEYLLARNSIENQLIPHIKTWMEGTTKVRKDIGLLIENLGGLEHQVADLARCSIDALYKATGNDFFVSSFCGTPTRRYEEENGLLSQWRGYGQKQGLLLKFETKALEDVMKHNAGNSNPEMMFLANVFYTDDEEYIQNTLSADFNQIKAFVLSANNAILNQGVRPNGQEAMRSFVRIATRIKHQDGPIPFVKLFGTGYPMLPIRKIIVGPSKSKFAVAEALRKGMRGRNIEITVSDIPYV
jgi:Protein of unknown function (DUF2971)